MSEEETKRLEELLKGLLDFPKEAEEEQRIGLQLFKTTSKNLGKKTIGEWLYCEEHEDVLVPVRLPKGMADQLKLMDNAKEDFDLLVSCEKCEARADCPIPLRNPSEILLTVLMKLAFSKIFERILRKGGDPYARQDGSDIHLEV